MRKSIGNTKKIVISLCMCAILGSEALTAYADPSIDEVTDERDDTQDSLDSVNASIEELAEEQEGIVEEIEEINDALVQVMAEVEVLRLGLIDKEAEIATAQIAYDDALIKENEQYEAMKIRIQYMYEAGDPDYVAMLMEAGSISEMLTKADYIEDLYEYDRNMLQEYQNTVQEVADLKISLKAEKEEMLAMQSDYEEEQAYMEGVIMELQAVSDDYAAQIASAEAVAVEYARKLEEQNAEIARLEEEARREAEEAARRAAEEAARQAAAASVAGTADTGVIVTTNASSYDVSS
ncbi:MAG TPA: hypothetical protein PLZ77_04245, partial [Lachnospiraceae bacterium]|nr:hypothetical protein [Lachnospiraceae bacterium]